jgi:hypothetical protein
LVSLLAAGALSILPSSVAAAAGECIAAPNAPAPEGSHWYYHVDRASGGKCWHLGAVGQKVVRPTAKPIAQPSPARRPVDTPTEISPTETPPAAPPQDLTQQGLQGSGAGSPPAVRWPEPPQPAAATIEGETQAPVKLNALDRAQLKPPVLAASSTAAGDQESTVPPLQMIALLAGALTLAGLVARAVVRAASTKRPVADERVPPTFGHPVPPHTADLDEVTTAYNESDHGAEETLRRILRAWERRAA